MNTESRYKTLFDGYDTFPFKIISEQQLGHEVLALTPDPTNASDFEKAELFAFQFVEIYRNKDSSAGFYKPHRSRPLSDGTEEVYPDIKKVTSEMLKYWQHRAENSRHPVIKARYAGLVHEYEQVVSGERPMHTISRMFARALVDSVDQHLVTVFAYKSGKLEKALMIALQLKDQDLLEEVKRIALQIELEVPLAETKNFWTYPFDMLLQSRRQLLTKTEEANLISRLVERFSTVIVLDLEAAWQAGKRLAFYYYQKQDKDNTLLVLKQMENAISLMTSDQPSFQKIYWWEKLYKFFDEYGLKAHGVSLLTQIREQSKISIDEFKSISGSATVTQADVDAEVNAMLKLEGEKLFKHLALRYSLNRTEIEEQVKQTAEQNPFYSIFTKDIVDAKGRKVGEMPPYHENPGPYITQAATVRIKFNALFYRFVIEEGVKRGIVTVSELMKYIQLSPIFETANLTVIHRAVVYYINKDHVGFIHTIIPQLEEGVRNLIETHGGNVLIIKDRVHMLRTFDHLLSDPIFIDKVGDSTCLHFRSLLTDKVGMNLRNDVAHGYIHPEQFNQQNADALMIALLILVLRTIL